MTEYFKAIFPGHWLVSESLNLDAVTKFNDKGDANLHRQIFSIPYMSLVHHVYLV